MFSYALNNLRNRKLRTALTITGIAICVMLYVIMASTLNSMIADLEHELAKYAGQMFVQVGMPEGDEFPPLTGSIAMDTSQEILNSNADVLNQERSSPVLLRVLAEPAYPTGPPRALAVGIMPGHEKAYIGDAETAAGEAQLATAGTVVMGTSAAEFYNVQAAGDTLNLMGEEFTVAGILNDDMGRVTTSLVLFSLNDAMRVTNQAEPTALLLTVKNLSDLEQLSGEIENSFSGHSVITPGDMATRMDAALRGSKDFMGMINYTVIFTAVIVIMIVMYMAVMERTRELGTLRALGASRRKVLTCLVMEAVLISLAAGLLGNILSHLILYYTSDNFAVTSTAALQGLGAAVAIGLLGGLIPAWKATQISPQEALRYE